MDEIDRAERKRVYRDAKLVKARARTRRLLGPPFVPTAWQMQAARDFAEVDVLVLSGPPGTAKTATATWLAVEELAAERVSKIYLVRPAVEAGEKLGFLPGDLYQKLHPYLVPVFEFLKSHGLNGPTLIKSGTLEVVPIAYAKGRTFADGVILFDEVQDCTRKQLRLILGRMGVGSKMILTGDPDQSDCYESPNPFRMLTSKLDLASGCGYVHTRLTDVDILRHEMVAKLLKLCE